MLICHASMILIDFGCSVNVCTPVTSPSVFPYQILHGRATMAQALESARSQSLGMQWTSSFQVRENFDPELVMDGRTS